MTDATLETTERTVRVWDPVVRIFHWGMVAAVATAWLSAEESETIHEVAGYVVAGLLGARLVWGLIGTRHARFGSFLRGPGTTVRYLRDMMAGRERRYIGHNPAGAAMIVALLLALSGTAFTGWLMADTTRVAMLPEMPAVVSPAFADDDGERGEYGEGGEELLEEVHEVLANLLLVLIAPHVGGVILASVRHNENLARAMVTGTKRGAGHDDID
ncbi:cytochrome b/b6 domain-containing protein [Maritimibacter sp. UBA3975]|uniref:cytochrome b/b6 domain-containing protein n=1 Tax=Maritimibacter sp. UBA3975 TaxID=1946833 RepID=UPI000C0AF9AD|nr:cytochrome b/b6 domain-containing protein [Maritimibacter sp. UBA3975]MAM63845.1 cytochrome B [Maritimibacter sp.]|tara:strand:+ start:90728 stop:91372 length:645 start_codon:yes stop_codon:yes gene_type:complete